MKKIIAFFMTIVFMVTMTLHVSANAWPELVAVYNSADGADIRWKDNGAGHYYIMRKENGKWNCIASVGSSSLEKDGNNFKYIDNLIKGDYFYGKGYIYSVAVGEWNNPVYDTAGLPLYRLNQPKITSAYKTSETSVIVTWNKEACDGYEVQYSTDEGKTWIKTPEVTGTSIVINNLDLSKNDYIFRMRTERTNADRGTTWSQYSAWAKLGGLEKPVLVAIYNSADGADIRFKEVKVATSYIIMRKEDGVWKEIEKVSATSLAKEGGNYKYIDGSVKSLYGKGFIYSVACENDSGRSDYDKAGLAFYRLKAPGISSIKTDGIGKVLLNWTKETCQGYEIQFSSDNGKTWTKYYMQINSGDTTSLTVNGLKVNTKYVFRIRCQKTNSDRGTVWSPYSAWATITTSNASYPRERWYTHNYDTGEEVDTCKWKATAGEFRTFVTPIELTTSNWKDFFELAVQIRVTKDAFGDITSRGKYYVIRPKEPYVWTSETALKLGARGQYVAISGPDSVSVYHHDEITYDSPHLNYLDGTMDGKYVNIGFNSINELDCIKVIGNVYRVEIPEELIYRNNTGSTYTEGYWADNCKVCVGNYEDDWGQFEGWTERGLDQIAEAIYVNLKTWR